MNHWMRYSTCCRLVSQYIKYANALKEFIKRGFSAAVYAQTTDVEGEVNGLITYDRKVIKVEEDRLRKANQEISGYFGR